MASGNKPCRWPYCLQRDDGDRCSCKDVNIVSISPTLYNYGDLYRPLKNSIDAEWIAFVDLVDPELRRIGITKLGRLIQRMDGSIKDIDFEKAFATPVNARSDRNNRFYRPEFSEEEINAVKLICTDLYLEGSKSFVQEYPEFSQYYA